MHFRVILLVFILLISTFPLASAQVQGYEDSLINGIRLYDFSFSLPLRDFDFLGGGARARAMGGAFWAISDDPSAGSWNPAGLVEMNKIQTSFSLLTSNWDNKYENSIANVSFEKTKSQLNNLSLVVPFKLSGKDFVGSAVLYQPAIFRDNYVIPTDAVGNSYRFDVDGRLSAVGLAVGGKLFPNLSLGATVNIYSGTLIYNKYQAFAPFGNPPDDTLITTRILNKASYSGANVSLGLKYQIQKLHLAALIKTPLTLKETDDVRWLYDFTVRGVTNPLPSGQQGFLYKTDRKWKIPTFWGLGAAYSISENLLLAADLEIRNLSQMKLLYQTNVLDPVTPFTEDKTLKLDNTSQFRIGAEYVINTAKYGKFPVRVGYRNQPETAVPLSEIIGDSSDARGINYRDISRIQANTLSRSGKLSGNIYTLGIGWAKAQIKLDVAWEIKRLELKNSGTSSLGSFTEKNNYNLSRFIFNFTGYF